MPSERKGDCSCAPCAEKQDVKNRSAFKTYRNHKAMKSWSNYHPPQKLLNLVLI
uniref:Uncharacterized protein n=1 Tax=Magallana gigas TaxID=29159 RepID=K1RBF0_MAGGI